MAQRLGALTALPEDPAQRISRPLLTSIGTAGMLCTDMQAKTSLHIKLNIYYLIYKTYIKDLQKRDHSGPEMAVSKVLAKQT